MRRYLLTFTIVFLIAWPLAAPVANGAAAIAYITKEFGLDVVARLLARTFLNQLSNNVIKTINTLGDGSGTKGPTFIQDWKKFLGEAESMGLNQFRAQVGYLVQNNITCDSLKQPLGKIFNSEAVGSVNIGGFLDKLRHGALADYQTALKCTVPKAVSDEFEKDFKLGGGWDTWARMLEPQNNLIGALALSLEELAIQQDKQATARKTEAVSGQGFTGIKNGCTGTGKNGECIFFGETVTPAKILGEGAAGWLDNNSKWLVGSDELSEVLMNIAGAALNRLSSWSGVGFNSGTNSDKEVDAPTTPDSTTNGLQQQYTQQQSQDNATFMRSQQLLECKSKCSAGDTACTTSCEQRYGSTTP